MTTYAVVSMIQMSGLIRTFLYFYYSYSKSYLFTIKHKIYQAQKRKKDLLYVMTEPLKAPINVSVKVPGDKV